MTIEQKLEKKINTIVQLTGEYPKELEVTKQEQEQLETDNFRGVKLIVKQEALMNREEIICRINELQKTISKLKVTIKNIYLR